MEVIYVKSFVKQYNALPDSVKRKVKDRIEIFKQNPFEPLLSNHSLHGPKQGYRSINITGDYRAIYEEIDDVPCFVSVGTRSELYG